MFPPRGCFAKSREVLDYYDWRRATGIYWLEPGMLLSCLQCTGRPLAAKNYPLSESVVLKLRNPVLTGDAIMKEWIPATESAVRIENNL